MKKLLALLLSSAMVFSMGITAFAESRHDEYDDDEDYEVGGEFGIDYGQFTRYPMTPGQLYAFDIVTEDGYLADWDWKDAHSITWNITSGENIVTEFYIDQAQDGRNYQLYIQTDPTADYTNDKTIKFTMRAKNNWRDEDGDRGKYYGEAFKFEGKLKVGYGNSARNKIEDDYFEIEPLSSAVTLDKDCTFMTAYFKNVGYLDFKVTETYQYIFAYNTVVPKTLIHENEDNYLEAWNITGKPVLDAPGTLSYLSDSNMYVYKLNDDGSYTPMESTYSTAYRRIKFVDQELGSYLFAQKPLQNATITSADRYTNATVGEADGSLVADNVPVVNDNWGRPVDVTAAPSTPAVQTSAPVVQQTPSVQQQTPTQQEETTDVVIENPTAAALFYLQF